MGQAMVYHEQYEIVGERYIGKFHFGPWPITFTWSDWKLFSLALTGKYHLHIEVLTRSKNKGWAKHGHEHGHGRASGDGGFGGIGREPRLSKSLGN